MPRPKILDGNVCYNLFKQTKSIAGVQAALKENGILSPFSKDGTFSIKAVKMAIMRDVPEAKDHLTMMPEINEARTNMLVLKAKMKKASPH